MELEQEPVAPISSLEMGVSSSVEATLPLAVSPKWVAYACRMAGVAKPRWNRIRAEWTSASIGSGIAETIVMKHGARPKTIVIEVLSGRGYRGPASEAPDVGAGTPPDTATARRLVTAFFTGMQWAVRQRAQA